MKPHTVVSPLRRAARAAILAVLGSGVASAGGVIIAERPQAGNFATIQAGIDAALEGESLLVTPGAYPPFTIDGKSVNVFVTGGGEATIVGSVRVRNLAPAQSCVLSRLRVDSSYPNGTPALEVELIAGHLRLQDSTFRGTHTQVLNTSIAGADVESSLNVVFSGCLLRGGHGLSSGSGYFPFEGGTGLESLNSAIAVYDCVLQGGDGSTISDPRGGHGGAGFRGFSYGLFATGCMFRGGRGGEGDWPAYCVGGTGGDALVSDSAQAHLLENSYVAGTGGFGQKGNGPQAPNGGTIVPLNGAIIDLMAGTRRKISAPSITGDDLGVPITIVGEPGDQVHLLIARKPSFLWSKPAHGTWLVPTPSFMTALPAGTIGANGTLVLQRTFAIPDGTVAARLFWLQAICVDTAGKTRLTGPAHVLSLE